MWILLTDDAIVVSTHSWHTPTFYDCAYILWLVTTR